MQLSHPLRDLLPEAQARVVRVLSRTEHEFTGRAVADIAETPLTSTQRALRHLVHVGLVRERRDRAASYYTMNKDHLLWPTIESVRRVHQELKKRLFEFMDDCGVDVVSLAIFGSVARMTSSDKSDVDLVLVVGDSVNSDDLVDVVGRLSDAVELWTGNTCQVFDLTLTDIKRYQSADDPLLDSWRRDRVHVYGTDIRDYLE